MVRSKWSHVTSWSVDENVGVRFYIHKTMHIGPPASNFNPTNLFKKQRRQIINKCSWMFITFLWKHLHFWSACHMTVTWQNVNIEAQLSAFRNPQRKFTQDNSPITKMTSMVQTNRIQNEKNIIHWTHKQLGKQNKYPPNENTFHLALKLLSTSIEGIFTN